MSGAVPLLLLYAFMALATNVAVSFVLERIFLLFPGAGIVLRMRSALPNVTCTVKGSVDTLLGFLKCMANCERSALVCLLL